MKNGNKLFIVALALIAAAVFLLIRKKDAEDTGKASSGPSSSGSYGSVPGISGNFIPSYYGPSATSSFIEVSSEYDPSRYATSKYPQGSAPQQNQAYINANVNRNVRRR